MSNFTFFHNVFYAVCILKSLNSHISVVVCSFFEFRTVSKLCMRECINIPRTAPPPPPFQTAWLNFDVIYFQEGWFYCVEMFAYL